MKRVLWAGTFDPGFHRNRQLQKLLELAGYEVDVRRVELWGSERPEIPTGGKLRMLTRALVAFPRLIWKFLRAPRADVCLLAHPGWFDAIVLSPFARLKRIPVVFDMQFSLYDSVVSDRALANAGSLLGRFCLLVDRLCLRLVDRAIADSPAHARLFDELADLPPGKVGHVWLGTHPELFHPLPDVEPVAGRAMFHGTFIPNQGVETIIRAAKLIEPDGIEVRLIGAGQQEGLVDRLIEELEPRNLVRMGLVPLEQVPREIAEAQLCLGIFGITPRSRHVVPNKLFECLAVGRPVLTADTETIRAAFEPGEVATAQAGDPESVAAEIRRLMADAEGLEAIGRAGHERYLRSYAREPLSRMLDAELQQAIDRRA